MFSTSPEIQVPAPVRCPKAYSYARHSHRYAIDANEGIPQQGVRTRRYFDANLATEGVEWGGFVPDESAISARTNPFRARLAGQTLITLLRPGDYFLIDKIDRLVAQRRGLR